MGDYSHISGNLPQLTLTNFSYWYDALEIHARTIDAHDHLTNQIAPPTDPAVQTSHQRKADQIRTAIMQSLSPDVVKLLPPHILRYSPHNICTTIQQTVDTCSVENHELLDAEARTLKPMGQDIHDYISKYRDLRHRMKVSGYPNIETERTKVRYIVQGLAHHPDMHALAVMLACNPPTTIREFTNHLQQVQLIQDQAPKNQIEVTQRPQTPPPPPTQRHRAARSTKTRDTPRHYEKPVGHTGTWCHHHGSITDSTTNCFARRKITRQRTAQAKPATANKEQESDENNIGKLQERLQFLENALAEQQATDDGKKKFILDSGAQPTHTTTPHATMRKSTGTLTETANGQREKITHRGTIHLQTRNKTIELTAVHTSRIKENLLSVHDLTKYGDVTFTRTHAYLHPHTTLPPSLLTAKYKNGQYQVHTTTKAEAKGARTNRQKKPSAIKPHTHHIRASRKKGAIKKNTHKLRATRPPPHIQPRIPTRHGITLAATRKRKTNLRNAQGPRHKNFKRTAAQQELHEWHLKMGHAHPKTLAIMSRRGLLPALPRGLTDNSSQITCSGCINGKTTTRPHRRTTHNSVKGESLSSDVCGPIKPTSTHNANYFLTLIDTATRYIWVYCLHNRSQVPQTIIDAIEHTATQVQKYPRLLVTDNAKEYLAKDVQEQLRRRGIQSRPTTPYTPQENALAERINRTLMEKVRATLAHSQLPQAHWQDALQDAVYKYNLTYHHALKSIPYTAWHNKPPTVRAIFTFGQLGYTPVLKPNAPKLQNKATPIRYMFGLNDMHICVQHINTGRYIKMRAADFRPYHRQNDPCTTVTMAFKAHSSQRNSKRETRAQNKTTRARRRQAKPTPKKSWTPQHRPKH